jgi:pyridoxamine 5'-phosphate oxidase
MSDRWIPLHVADCDPDPFVQFRKWFDEAEPEMNEREAVALVTSTLDGQPSARMVLLRHVGRDSFGWFTNFESRKGHDLRANHHAALLWYCEPLGRQIRVEGTVTKMGASKSDAYFKSRARGHQIGAHASRQSEPLASRQVIEERVRELEVKFEGVDVPRPKNWGGYLLHPTFFEFWQHRDDRLHDRVFYTHEHHATHLDVWNRERRSP